MDDADRKRFNDLTQDYLEKTKGEAEHRQILSNAVYIIKGIRDVVSPALSAFPPAGIAWSGVCLVLLPVGRDKMYYFTALI